MLDTPGLHSRSAEEQGSAANFYAGTSPLLIAETTTPTTPRNDRTSPSNVFRRPRSAPTLSRERLLSQVGFWPEPAAETTSEKDGQDPQNEDDVMRV